MRSRSSSFAENDSSVALLSIALVVGSTITTAAALPKHSLAISAISWTLVYIYSILRKGESGVASGTDRSRRTLRFAAGILLVVGEVCERTAGGGEGLWWNKAFLPAAILLQRWLEIDARVSSIPRPNSSPISDNSARNGSKRLLCIITCASLAVLLRPFVPSPTIALGLCRVFFVALAYNFIDEAFNSDHGEKSIGVGGFVSANGSFSRDRPAVQSSSGSKFITVLRDVAAIAALGCAVGAFLFESFRMDALTFRHELEGIMGQNWKTGQWRITLGQGAVVTIVGTVNCVLTVLMLQRRGALNAGFIGLGGAMCANLVTAITAFRSYFTFISAAAIYSYLSGPGSSNYGAMESRRTMRRRQFITLVSLLSFGVWIVLLLSRSHASGMMKNGGSFFPINSSSPPSEPPNHPSISNFHPINQLINHAEKELDNVKSRQSKSLEEAVTEYRRRYGLPPPPNFDKWYEFAVKNGVQLIDEYDTIHDSLLPFWALDPSIIRSRVREALGFDNALMGMSIRAGQPVLIEKGPEWQQKATVGIMKAFVNHLPDMDLAFNLHDEPRVVVPHEELSKLVSNARNTAMPAAFANKSPQNSFSKRPSDMNDGRKMAEFQITRFNKYAHQPTWLPSKLSCPPESPARAISETAQDNLTSYALGDLGFVFNVTAFSDICESPSLRQTYGFFDRPNAFNIVHDLFPIFSQSKVSSFQDILYPSPWYWYGKVMYEADKDMEWTDKATKMYWRGSTTGGFSRDGGWRRQHRQKVIQKMNAPDEAKILENNGDEGSPAWHVKEVPRQDYKDLFDVRFSHVGQCDPNDCDAQKEFFDIAETAGQQDAWASKFLLDIDGNAFSGRFYAFLKSKSLVYKLAVFREWHQEWLRPWAHYVPLSLRGDEFVESVRYFANETDGDAQARWIAFQGSDWADKVLRNVDFEAWFFRLLLEYGRVIDDHRELIGYAGP